MLHTHIFSTGLKKALGCFVLAGFVLAGVAVNFPVQVARADDISDSTVSAVPNSGTLTAGQTLQVIIHQNSQMDNLTLDPAGACTINGKAVTDFTYIGNGDYRLTYTVAAEDNSAAAGQVPFSCALKVEDQQFNVLTAFTDGNTVAIDASGTGGNNNNNNNTGTTTDDNNNNNNNNTGTTTNNTTNNSTQNGTINGDVTGTQNNGVLAVTQIEQIRTVAVADGTIDNGWKWVFHITVPSNEPNVSLKFDNWMHTNGVNTLSPAANMRISSSQTTGGPVMITAANTYSTALVANGDLDSSAAGRQIQVAVEMGVPVGATNGSYSTTYSVKTSQ